MSTDDTSELIRLTKLDSQIFRDLPPLEIARLLDVARAAWWKIISPAVLLVLFLLGGLALTDTHRPGLRLPAIILFAAGGLCLVLGIRTPGPRQAVSAALRSGFTKS